MRQEQISAREVVWYNPKLITEPLERLFDPEYWQAEERVLGSALGRGVTWFVQTQQLPAALRHYRRGGLFGKIVSDNYLFTGWKNTRSYAEFQLLEHLAQKGVNVPRPLAARVIKCGLLYQADLLSELISNAQDLISILKERPLSANLYQKIGQEIRKMHDVQVNHTDLNIHNILIDHDEKVWIIDFDKCAVHAGDKWKEANIQRLLRSFKKEQGKANIHWQESEFDHLLAGYRA